MKKFVFSILSIFFILWVGIVLYPYFKVHYSYLALFLSKNLPFDKLYYFFFLALFNYALGRMIFRLFRFKFYFLLEEFVFASGIGWMIGAYMYEMMSIFSYWKYNWIPMLIVFLLFIRELLLIVRIFLSRIKFVLGLKFTLFNITLWYLLAVTVFFTLSLAISPITFEKNELISLSLPFSIEMVLSGNEMFCKLLHFYFGILTILGMFALIKRHFNSESGLLAICIFYISSLVIFLSGTARDELGLTFYELLMIYSLLCWITSNKISWFVLQAFCLGFALVNSYQAFYYLIGIIPIIFYHCLFVNKGKPLPKRVFTYIGLGGLFLLIILPWYVLALCNCRTFSQIKNPVFSPIYLLCLPLVIFILKETLMTKYLFSYIVIQFLIGFYSKIELLPVFMLSAILLAHLIYNLKYTLLKRVILSVITIVFILTLSYEGYVIFNHRAPLKFIYGLEEAEDYIARNIKIGFFPNLK